MKRYAAWWVCLALAGSAGAVDARTTTFTVLLDGEPIGEHRFVQTPQRDGLLELTSEANFQVRLLGVPVYRYQHRAQELWQGDCLQTLKASTQDGGESTQVDASRVQGALVIETGERRQQVDGCLMSFAYWNPVMQRQNRLLNVQTGRIEQVQLTRIETAQIDVRGQMVSAQRWRLSGTERPLDVWWTAQGQWVGLDATVSGGRKLSYRLR
ncbi:DUF6134 family protein [Variovorax dokdonensis]|uniref:DUF6134 family protein n=1 Tax=Variovorax dokdonensis TaxID=344883 RepID=A0ABT7N996_9BURK|nr:DUF6134 family protein [Variovorax dokdonensis]MDM0044502.1 DUF6134 family protein [Variovorax dokdonensis]